MLSATYTLTDVQAEMMTYDYYDENYTSSGFASDLVRSAEYTERMLYSYISSTYYDYIQNKDKIDLTESETNIYWAEVYLIIHNFLKWLDRKSLFKREAEHSSISEGGVTRSTYGQSGKAMSAAEYYSLAMQELNQAGVDTTIYLFGSTCNNSSYYMVKEFFNK